METVGGWFYVSIFQPQSQAIQTLPSSGSHHESPVRTDEIHCLSEAIWYLTNLIRVPLTDGTETSPTTLGPDLIRPTLTATCGRFQDSIWWWFQLGLQFGCHTRPSHFSSLSPATDSQVQSATTHSTWWMCLDT